MSTQHTAVVLTFKPIPGFPGYRVRSDGQAQTCRRFRGLGYGRGIEWYLSEKWVDLKPDTDKRGRRRFTLSKDSKTLRFRSSTLVLLAFVGSCPVGMERCHGDGNLENDLVTNLRWDTHLNNMRDRTKHGTHKGETHWKASLTEDDVRLIRVRRASGEEAIVLGKEYKMTRQNIDSICSGRSWIHVK